MNHIVETLEAELRDDPNSRIFLPLALEYDKLGLFEDAIRTLRTGIELHPDYTGAHLLLGKVYTRRKQLSSAITEFETVVKQSPDNLLAFKKLTELYCAVGDTDRAIETYRTVLNVAPRDTLPPDVVKILMKRDKPAKMHGRRKKIERRPEPQAIEPSPVEPAAVSLELDAQLPKPDDIQGLSVLDEAERMVEEELFKLSESVNDADARREESIDEAAAMIEQLQMKIKSEFLVDIDKPKSPPVNLQTLTFNEPEPDENPAVRRLNDYLHRFQRRAEDIAVHHG